MRSLWVAVGLLLIIFGGYFVTKTNIGAPARVGMSLTLFILGIAAALQYVLDEIENHRNKVMKDRKSEYDYKGYLRDEIKKTRGR